MDAMRCSGVRRSTVVFVIASCSSSVCLADPVAIQRCRAVVDPIARLQCYDAIPTQEPSRAAESRARLPVVSDRSAIESTAERFGLESQRQPVSGRVDSIESSIPGRFEGWVPRSRIRLANGQVWEIRDDSVAAYDLLDPKVRIVRGVAGSFFMEIESVSHSPRVRRVE